MPIESFAAQNCSVARTLSILGERWTLIVLTELFLGRRRFDEIQEERGIATNVLSQRLATLVDEGIAERRRYSEHPERFEYHLTDKGRELLPLQLALLAWGDKYMSAGKPPVESIHTECGHPFHLVATCSHCGKELKRGTVQARLGPGASGRQRQRAQRRRKRHESEAARQVSAPGPAL
jgi:DNA-binding HxlR family transcriptional regulator